MHPAVHAQESRNTERDDYEEVGHSSPCFDVKRHECVLLEEVIATP
jgi:hypothetical protein